mmetsp:Transcript_28454/g.69372  ORF Transcript_28454/g.69372 Transcript_28454/m.69372 type:complete len:230 (+) Transcript_28454:1578-2267(+)
MPSSLSPTATMTSFSTETFAALCAVSAPAPADSSAWLSERLPSLLLDALLFFCCSLTLILVLIRSMSCSVFAMSSSNLCIAARSSSFDMVSLFSEDGGGGCCWSPCSGLLEPSFFAASVWPSPVVPLAGAASTAAALALALALLSAPPAFGELPPIFGDRAFPSIDGTRVAVPDAWLSESRDMDRDGSPMKAGGFLVLLSCPASSSSVFEVEVASTTARGLPPPPPPLP